MESRNHSYPLEEIDVRKLLHLVHITFCFDHFFVIEKNPCFFLAVVDGNRFADECYVVSRETLVISFASS